MPYMDNKLKNLNLVYSWSYQEFLKKFLIIPASFPSFF